MDVSGGKLDMNRVSQCVHHSMNLGISTTASNPNALILLESLAIPTGILVSFGAIRNFVFLHLHLLYEL